MVMGPIYVGRKGITHDIVKSIICPVVCKTNADPSSTELYVDLIELLLYTKRD